MRRLDDAFIVYLICVAFGVLLLVIPACSSRQVPTPVQPIPEFVLPVDPDPFDLELFFDYQEDPETEEEEKARAEEEKAIEHHNDAPDPWDWVA